MTKRCDITDDNVKAVKDIADTNTINVDELTNATANNFEMVREDAVKGKNQIAGLKVDLGDVDDKIKINNLVSTNLDMVVGSIEKKERDEAEAAMKKFFTEYVTKSERKLVEKEEERERIMKEQVRWQRESAKAKNVQATFFSNARRYEPVWGEHEVDAGGACGTAEGNTGQDAG